MIVIVTTKDDRFPIENVRTVSYVEGSLIGRKPFFSFLLEGDEEKRSIFEAKDVTDVFVAPDLDSPEAQYIKNQSQYIKTPSEYLENHLFKHCCVQFLGGTWHQGWVIPADAYPKANKKSKYYLLCDDGRVRGFSPTTIRQIKRYKGE